MFQSRKTSGIKLLIGLGNPGKRYLHTRHNIGFRVIEALAKRHKMKIQPRLFSKARQARTVLFGQEVILIEPTTFMNRSGESVLSCINRYKAGLADILVVCDDINLPLGTIRMRAAGSAGGHNGLESIIRSLKTDIFPRLKIGISRDAEATGLVDYVLSEFKGAERQTIEEAVIVAADACECWLRHGIQQAMSECNNRSVKQRRQC